MPRFYFHLHECGVITPDREGRVCGDLNDARRFAIEAARSVMAAEILDGQLCLSCHIEVVDRAGKPIITVRFAEAVVLTGA